MDRDEFQTTADELLQRQKTQQKTPDRPKEIVQGTGTVMYKPAIGGPQTADRVRVEDYARYDNERRNQHIKDTKISTTVPAVDPSAPEKTEDKSKTVTPPVPPRPEEKAETVTAPRQVRVQGADAQKRRDQQAASPVHTPATQPKPEAKPEKEIDAGRFRTDPDYRREVLAKATQEITKGRQQNANRQMERGGRGR